MTTQAMKWFTKDNEIFKSFRENKSIKLAGQLCFFFLILSFGLFLFTLKKLPPQVPLFYSLPWGEEQLAPNLALFFLPLGMLLVAVLNSFFIMIILKEYSLAAKILTWVTVALFFLTGITLAKIIFLIL